MDANATPVNLNIKEVVNAGHFVSTFKGPAERNMALNRKYAALPDLDSAPDIYETVPELTGDNSTAPVSEAYALGDAAY